MGVGPIKGDIMNGIMGDKGQRDTFTAVPYPKDMRAFARYAHGHTLLKIAVSGAAATGYCGLDVFEKAKEVGREIARQGAAIVTGATTGFAFYATMGAKEEGGFSIGFSPAATEREHVEVYKLPLDYMDVIVYTGFGYSGRDLLMVRSSDAVIIGCGRIGTINEFAVAFEDRRPIGIVEGSWDTDEILQNIITTAHRANPRITINSNAKSLVEGVITQVKKDKQELNLVYRSRDGVGGTGRNSEVIL